VFNAKKTPFPRSSETCEMLLEGIKSSSARGVEVEYGEPLYEGEYRGTFRTVGDKEHAEMIRLYIEEGLSLEKIAEQFSRSSRTPLLHLQKHNRAVERSGFCQACRRVKSGFESIMAEKNIIVD